MPPPASGDHKVLSLATGIQARLLGDAGADLAPEPRAALIKGGATRADADNFRPLVPLTGSAFAQAASLPSLSLVDLLLAVCDGLWNTSPQSLGVTRFPPSFQVTQNAVHYHFLRALHALPLRVRRAAGGAPGDGLQREVHVEDVSIPRTLT